MYNISGTLLLLVLLTTQGSRGHKLAQTSLDEAECREERLVLRLLVAELLQMPQEGLWDDLQLGDEEPLKVAKRFIYSRKLQPKYFQLLKAYKSLLDTHPPPSQSEMNRNLLTTKMLDNEIVAWPQMPTPSPTL